MWANQSVFPWSSDGDVDDCVSNDDGDDNNNDDDGDGEEEETKDSGDGGGDEVGDDDWYHLLCQPLGWFTYITPYNPIR